jgi:hypothetical protein
MPKLNDTQLIILSTASARDNRAVLPLPKSLKLSKEETAKLLQGLLRQKLIAEWPAVVHEPIWREKNGKQLTLVISDKGLETIGVSPEDVEPVEQPEKEKREKPVPVKSPPVKQGKKKPDLILAMLSRAKGATIEQLQEATDWQAHSVRAVISILRKKGTSIVRSQGKDGTTLYQVEK